MVVNFASEKLINYLTQKRSNYFSIHSYGETMQEHPQDPSPRARQIADEGLICPRSYVFGACLRKYVGEISTYGRGLFYIPFKNFTGAIS